jgi:hypothetical protein
MRLRGGRAAAIGVSASLVASLLVGGLSGVRSVAGATGNTWTTTGALSGSVWNPATVHLLDGRILILSGENFAATVFSHEPPPAPEIYDPVAGTWSATSAPPWAPDTCQGQFAVLLTDGRVLVGGGFGSTASVCGVLVYIYDPTAASGGSWTNVASLPVGLSGISYAGAARLANGHVMVAMGWEGGPGTSGEAYAYDPTANTWTALTFLASGILEPVTIPLPDGRVFFGSGWYPYGSWTESSGGSFIYDPAKNSWIQGPALGWAGTEGVLLPDGRIFLAGGERLYVSNAGQQVTYESVVTLFDPVTLKRSNLPPMHTPRANFTLERLPSGQILAAGGVSTNSLPTASAEIYDWTLNAWYPAASLHEAHGEQGSAVLGDGRILVAGGGTTTSELYLAGDFTPPKTAPPLTGLRSGTALGSYYLPGILAWSAVDGGGSGLASYDVARSLDGGAYTMIASGLTSPSLNVLLSYGHSFRFEVRAHDRAGNIGAWSLGVLNYPSLVQQSTSVVYHGTWSTSSSTAYSGGSARYSSVATAYASLAFSGRAVNFVTTRGPTRGAAKVYIDGIYVTTVSMYASTTTYRYAAYQKTWGWSGTHTIRIVIVGTAGHPRVDVDAFGLLR